MVTQLSVILNVPPPRLLLLREEEELPTSATISELGLGIADIIGESQTQRVCPPYGVTVDFKQTLNKMRGRFHGFNWWLLYLLFTETLNVTSRGPLMLKGFCPAPFPVCG